MKTYYMLTKPGIIMGNIITTAAGFAMASKGHFDFWLFLMTMIGLTFVIASGCVFNNYIDREADRKMSRTKDRALAKKSISNSSAILFAVVLGMIGITVLALYTNILAAVMAIVGFLIYVIVYGISKYHTSFGTLIGSLAGAMPPVVGYCAASGRLDAGAFILFAILVLWQMPHFFAIAVYRIDDYKAASIPVLPIEKGIYTTKVHMVLYTIAFIAIALMPTAFGYTGYAYLFATAAAGLVWLVLCLQGFNIGEKRDKIWARQNFRFSLVTIMVLCVMMAVDVV